MSDFCFMDKIKDEDACLFKRCIRRLLDSTFIVADRDERLYEFISAEGNQYDMNVYLGAIGYKVVVEDRMKVAMLQQADEDVDTVGLKRISLYRFNQKEIRLLLVVWMGAIRDKCALYQIALTPAEIRGAYRVFKRFSLIDYNDDDITKEDGVIRLYPSLQFCMDIGQLKQVVADYVPDLSGEEADPGEGEKPEDGTGAEGLPGEEPEGEEADE